MLASVGPCRLQGRYSHSYSDYHGRQPRNTTGEARIHMHANSRPESAQKPDPTSSGFASQASFNYDKLQRLLATQRHSWKSRHQTLWCCDDVGAGYNQEAAEKERRPSYPPICLSRSLHWLCWPWPRAPFLLETWLNSPFFPRTTIVSMPKSLRTRTLH